MFTLRFSNNDQNARLLFDTVLTSIVIGITRCFMPARAPRAAPSPMPDASAISTKR